jgi:hypothetical protein
MLAAILHRVWVWLRTAVCDSLSTAGQGGKLNARGKGQLIAEQPSRWVPEISAQWQHVLVGVWSNRQSNAPTGGQTAQNSKAHISHAPQHVYGKAVFRACLVSMVKV